VWKKQSTSEPDVNPVPGQPCQVARVSGVRGNKRGEEEAVTTTEPQGDRRSEGQSRREALDELVINELARGCTYEEAATAAGWSARTVARRMRESGFRQRVSELRSAWVSEMSGRLVDSGSTAIDVIVEECRTAERSGDRLRAAGMLLSMGLRIRESHELEERLHTVEVRLGLTDPPGDHTEGGSATTEDDGGGR
jgi:hypothetical protein